MHKSTSAIATLENLEPRVVMGAGLFASAVGVEVPINGLVTVADAIARKNQVDVFQFIRSADQSGLFTIDMTTFSGQKLRASLAVYDANGLLLAASSSPSSRERDSHVEFQANPGETYFVQAAGLKKTRGDYRLSFNGGADDYGNSLGTAAVWSAPAGGAGTLVGQINYIGDIDYVRMQAARTGTLRVAMVPTAGSPLDSELAILSNAGKLLAVNNNPGGADAQVAVNVLQGQVYYLRAAGAGWTSGGYRLDIVAPQPDALPGAAVAAVLLATPGGVQLRVQGTDLNDLISLSQIGGTITVADGSTQIFSGAAAAVTIYGFAGADTIRVTNLVAVPVTVYGGAGDDSIFVAGGGADTVYGEAGDDLIVSIGGGGDRLYGGEGIDSFWYDATDTVADASATEIAWAGLHQVTQFYQPYTTNPTAPGYVPLDIAGQNLADPAAGSWAYRSFADRPLFADGPQYDDVAQGSVGDCYFLASLASLADSDPFILRQAIAPLGDGTFAVRFYRNNQPVYLRVDADLPTTAGGSLVYAKLGADGELWVPLMEKAYAYFRYGQNSYASLSGGWMSTVYREITNAPTAWMSTTVSAATLANYLRDHLVAGHGVTVGSYYGLPSSAPIVGSHAYQVQFVDTVSGTTYVTVYNPWGYDGRTWDGNRSDGLIRLTVDQFKSYFSDVCVSLA